MARAVWPVKPARRIRGLAAGALVWLGMVGATLWWPGTSHAYNTCVDCHSNALDERLLAPARLVPRSVHRHDDVGCPGCHGGSPEDPTARAHNPADGYVVHPTPERVLEICGGCHANTEFIGRHSENLPTDQLAQFRASTHGQAEPGADRQPPVCTSCHGFHDVTPATDENAKVHFSNVSATCGQCHETEQHDFEHSVHAARLGTLDDVEVATCNDCHGDHGEVKGEEAMLASCARCHGEHQEALDQSPHADAFSRLGFPGCVACHENHNIREASPRLLGAGPRSACRKCHASGQEAFSVARGLAVLARSQEDHEGPASIHRLSDETIEQALAAVGHEVPSSAEAPETAEEESEQLRMLLVAGLTLVALIVIFLLWRLRRRGES